MSVPRREFDFSGLGIMQPGGHIEGFVVKSHPDLGALAGRFAVQGVALGKMVTPATLPYRFRKPAVDADGLIRPPGQHFAVGGGPGRRRAEQRDPGQQ